VSLGDRYSVTPNGYNNHRRLDHGELYYCPSMRKRRATEAEGAGLGVGG
jgi:hypothetical protein